MFLIAGGGTIPPLQRRFSKVCRGPASFSAGENPAPGGILSFFNRLFLAVSSFVLTWHD